MAAVRGNRQDGRVAARQCERYVREQLAFAVQNVECEPHRVVYENAVFLRRRDLHAVDAADRRRRVAHHDPKGARSCSTIRGHRGSSSTQSTQLDSIGERLEYSDNRRVAHTPIDCGRSIGTNDLEPRLATDNQGIRRNCRIAFRLYDEGSSWVARDAISTCARGDADRGEARKWDQIAKCETAHNRSLIGLPVNTCKPHASGPKLLPYRHNPLCSES